jgi:hypothetical protein
MVRFSAINLFMAIMIFASAGFTLQSIRASRETALWDEIASQVEVNRIQLKSLQSELDQLEQQKYFVNKSIDVYYEYLDECSTFSRQKHRSMFRHGVAKQHSMIDFLLTQAANFSAS